MLMVRLAVSAMPVIVAVRVIVLMDVVAMRVGMFVRPVRVNRLHFHAVRRSRALTATQRKEHRQRTQAHRKHVGGQGAEGCGRRP